jgi:hypothetical protein
LLLEHAAIALMHADEAADDILHTVKFDGCCDAEIAISIRIWQLGICKMDELQMHPSKQ